jgi:hypothetical protein
MIPTHTHVVVMMLLLLRLDPLALLLSLLLLPLSLLVLLVVVLLAFLLGWTQMFVGSVRHSTPELTCRSVSSRKKSPALYPVEPSVFMFSFVSIVPAGAMHTHSLCLPIPQHLRTHHRILRSFICFCVWLLAYFLVLSCPEVAQATLLSTTVQDLRCTEERVAGHDLFELAEFFKENFVSSCLLQCFSHTC